MIIRVAFPIIDFGATPKETMEFLGIMDIKPTKLFTKYHWMETMEALDSMTKNSGTDGLYGRIAFPGAISVQIGWNLWPVWTQWTVGRHIRRPHGR